MEHPKDPKAERLLQLSEDVSRIAGSLARLSIGLGTALRQPPITNSNEPAILLDTVNWLIQARRDRACYLPRGLFADPAWDILLDLFRADLAREQFPVSRACAAAGVPESTALRWLKTLEQQGLVLPGDDCGGASNGFVTLAPDARSALRDYFVDVVEARSRSR